MPKENESPWASTVGSPGSIFLDAAHDDLERPVRKQPLQLRSLKSNCGPWQRNTQFACWSAVRGKPDLTIIGQDHRCWPETDVPSGTENVCLLGLQRKSRPLQTLALRFHGRGAALPRINFFDRRQKQLIF
jgi:hypothetical protein